MPQDLDVLCVGEALVDFLPDGRARRLRDVVQWTRCPGGSPANVAIGLARQQVKAGFLGVVGKDEFGHFLREALEREGVDTAWLRQTGEARTGLVFISLDEAGDRTFTFFRKPSAEFLLAPEDVAKVDLARVRVVHLGTNSLMLPAAQEAAKSLVARAREAGVVVSCDPNLRVHIWDEPRQLQDLVRALLAGSDLVKVAEDEAEFCTGERDPEKAVAQLAAGGATLAIATVGERGAYYRFRGATTHVPAPKVAVVDATGAGDGFVAGLLARLAPRLRAGAKLADLTPDEVDAAVRFGCVNGSAVCTKLGAVDALPFARS